jgi:hypothetical protein
MMRAARYDHPCKSRHADTLRQGQGPVKRIIGDCPYL